MSLSISAASAGYTPTTTHAPDGGAGVELAKLRREYSACINCATAETPEGQRNIQSLAAQIKTLEARQDEGRTSTASAPDVNAGVVAEPGVARLLDVWA